MTCSVKACVFPESERGLCAFHERDEKARQSDMGSSLKALDMMDPYGSKVYLGGLMHQSHQRERKKAANA